MLKKIIILKFFYFSLISVSFSDDLYQSLISTYINNKELNSQRQKTKAVDESLIQSYSTLKPSITGKFTQSDTLNESQKDGSGSTIADSNLQTKKKSIKVEQKILQGIPSILASKTDVKISRNQLKQVEQMYYLKLWRIYLSFGFKKIDITKII